jgi:hypothetical protein
MLDLWTHKALVLGIVGGIMLVSFLGFAIYMGVKEDSAWRANCVEKLGGRVRDVTHTGTTVGYDGKVGTTTSTTSYCLSSTGGVLDVK